MRCQGKRSFKRLDQRLLSINLKIIGQIQLSMEILPTADILILLNSKNCLKSWRKKHKKLRKTMNFIISRLFRE